MKQKLLFSIYAIFLTFGHAMGEEPKATEEQNIYINGMKIPLADALELVLRNNLTLRKSKYDVIMSDSAERRARKKYAPVVDVEASVLKRKQPASGGTVFSGDEFEQYELTASISKLFGTGTVLSAGITQHLSDSNDPEIPMLKDQDPAYYKPSLFFSVQQELLKNSFGENHRREDKLNKLNSAITRSALLDQLSGLVVQALIDYWQVTIEKKGVENAQKEVETATYVRNTIARNVRLGISEQYELNQYNSIVASAESRLSQREQANREAVRTLLRTVNMPPETQVSGITDLTDVLPSLNEQESLEAAFSKRIDYRNALRALEIARESRKISENNALPSLSAILSVQGNGQDEDILTANADLPGFTYPTWQASVKMSYPLWDEEIRTSVRDSRLTIKQREIEIEELKSEIRDDVLNRLEHVRLAHDVLLKTRRVRTESEAYYAKVIARSNQGRLNATVVKIAMDSLNSSRQEELARLIEFNVALLRLDLAKNEIFERYQIDIEKLIAEVE